MTVTTPAIALDATRPSGARRPNAPATLRRLRLPPHEPFGEPDRSVASLPSARHLERPGLPVTTACPGQLELDLPAQGTPRGGANDLGDAHRWVTQFVHAVLEVSVGRRPPGQLTRWTSREVHRLLERRHHLAIRSPSRPEPGGRLGVKTVRLTQPGPGVVEAAAVVADGHRVRALALRMQQDRGRWRVSALEIG